MPRKTNDPTQRWVFPLSASMRPRPDAAENLRVADALGGCISRFNEAAARCRGKQTRAISEISAPRASMRPRPDAAENCAPPASRPAGARRFNEAAARCRGKRAGQPPPRAGGGASMRPRPDAAENVRALPRQDVGHLGASMRPRPDAAENSSPPRRSSRGSGCFNEAAARCRGKRCGTAASARAHQASMRPRPDAAENSRSGPTRYLIVAPLQ